MGLGFQESVNEHTSRAQLAVVEQSTLLFPCLVDRWLPTHPACVTYQPCSTLQPPSTLGFPLLPRFQENGTHYAYYLITEHSPGEGFGVATSPNGATDWTDHGYVWHSPGPGWEGTGSVWRSPDFNRTGKYLINFSQCPRS